MSTAHPPPGKIVYVQRFTGSEPPQRVWVREPDQPPPSPDEASDYRLDEAHPHFPLTSEDEVQAWIRYMFHAGIWDVLRDVRFI